MGYNNGCGYNAVKAEKIKTVETQAVKSEYKTSKSTTITTAQIKKAIVCKGRDIV